MRQWAWFSKTFATGLVLSFCAVPFAFGISELSQSETQNVEATLRMLAAHEGLRRPEIADPDSEANRQRLARMIRFNLETKSLEAPAPMKRFVLNSEAWVGTLPVEVSTDNKGNFKVEIDFLAPKGRAGLAPDLGLYHGGGFYSDEAGTSFGLSTGFSSQIVRGRSLGARSGFVASAELTRMDRLYLDGKLLLCLGGEAEYGLPGSVYRTEVESDYIIHATGENGVVTGFVSDSGRGWKRYYGVVGESKDGLRKFTPAGRDDPEAQPAEYALKRVADLNGNYIEFNYTDRGNGEHTLETIEYTGGEELAPYYQIKLTYVESRRRYASYELGSRRDERHLLSEVTVMAGERKEIIAKYMLNYEQAGETLLDRLVKIDAWRAEDEDRPLKPVPPIALRWSDLSPEDLFSKSRILFVADKTLGTTAFAFDAGFDGTDDVVRMRERHVEVGQCHASSGEFGFSNWFELREPAEGDQWYVGDWSGDYREDFIHVQQTGIDFIEAKRPGSTGEPFGQAINQAPDWLHRAGAAPGAFISVVNRTGMSRKSVVVSSEKGFCFAEKINGAWKKQIEFLGCERPDEVAALVKVWWRDLNGDGREEPAVLLRRKSGDLELGYRLELIGGGLSSWQKLHAWTAVDAGQMSLEHGVIWGESNADSLPDVLIRTTSGEGNDEWILLHNRSVGGISARTMAEQFVRAGDVKLPHGVRPSWVDINHDWCGDLMWTEAGGAGSPDGIVVFRTGTGMGWAPEKRTRAPAFLSAELTARKTTGAEILHWSREKDFNSDGAADWVLAGGRQDELLYAVMLAPVANAHAPVANWLTDVMDGMGCVKSASYRSTNSTVVTDEEEIDLGPVVTLRGQRLVVSDRWNDEGTSKPSHFRYTYGGPRHDMSARGALGFTYFTTFDTSTNMMKYQFLTLSFPCTGLSNLEQTFLLNSEKDGCQVMLVAQKEIEHAADFVRLEDGTVPGTIFAAETRRVEYRGPNVVQYHAALRWSQSGVREPLPVKAYWREKLGSIASETLTRYDRQPPLNTASVIYKMPKTPWSEIENTKALMADFEVFTKSLSRTLVTASREMNDEGLITEKTTRYLTPDETFGAGAGLIAEQRETVRQGDKILRENFFRCSYVQGTRLVEQEYTEETKEGGETTKATTLSRYDDAGRMNEKFERGRDSNGEQAWLRVLKIDAFDPALGFAIAKTRKGYYPEAIEYNRVAGDSRLIKSSGGWTGEYEYDGLGRDVASRFKREGKEESKRRYWTINKLGEKYPPLTVRPPQGEVGETLVSAYVEVVAKTDETTTQNYYDRFGRRIVTLAYVSETDNARIDHVYDVDGREIFRSEPYPVKGHPKKWNKYSYDVLGYRIEKK